MSLAIATALAIYRSLDAEQRALFDALSLTVAEAEARALAHYQRSENNRRAAATAKARMKRRELALANLHDELTECKTKIGVLERRLAKTEGAPKR